MNREIEEMVKVMCCDRKNFKSCNSCKSANPNTKAYCRIEHYAVLLCKNDYRKSTDVAREIFAEIEKILKSSQTELVGQKFYFRVIVDKKIVALKKKYESEGADDEH